MTVVDYTEKIDLICALVGTILAGIIIIFLLLFLPINSSIRYILAPSILFCTCMLYIFYNNKLRYSKIDTKIVKYCHHKDIIFFILIFFTLISFYYRSICYERPIIIFLIVSLLIGLVSYEILFFPHNKISIYIILFKILLIFIILRLFPQFLFSGVVGIDPWWHQMFTNRIYELGYIPIGESYSEMPAMHIIISAIKIITDLSYKSSSIMLILPIQYSSYLLMYKLGKKIMSEKVGLMTLLILCYADFQIQYAMVLIPMSLGIVIITIISYLIYSNENDNNKKNICIFLLLLSLIITHALASFIILIIYLSLYISYYLYKILYNKKNKKIINISHILIFSILMIIWWTYYANRYILSLSNMIQYGFYSTSGGFSIQLESYSIENILQLLLSEMGFYLLIGFSIFGSLILLSKKYYTNEYKVSIVIIGFLLLILVFSSLLGGLIGILPGRWYPLLQIFISLQAAYGLILFICHINSKNIHIFFTIALIASFSFLMITDPVSNFDTPLYSDNITNRIAFIESEYISLNTISSHIQNNTIWIDQYPSYYLYYIIKMKVKHITPYIESNELYGISADEIIVIRREILYNPFGSYKSGVITLKNDPRPTLNNIFNFVYNSENTYAYIG